MYPFHANRRPLDAQNRPSWTRFGAVATQLGFLSTKPSPRVLTMVLWSLISMATSFALLVARKTNERIFIFDRTAIFDPQAPSQQALDILCYLALVFSLSGTFSASLCLLVQMTSPEASLSDSSDSPLEQAAPVVQRQPYVMDRKEQNFSRAPQWDEKSGQSRAAHDDGSLQDISSFASQWYWIALHWNASLLLFYICVFGQVVLYLWINRALVPGLSGA